MKHMVVMQCDTVTSDDNSYNCKGWYTMIHDVTWWYTMIHDDTEMMHGDINMIQGLMITEMTHG